MGQVVSRIIAMSNGVDIANSIQHTEIFESVPEKVGLGITSNLYSLLCHFTGADTSTTITDSTGRHSPVAVGNVQIDTAQSKFGGTSLLLDGTGDYVDVLDHTDWDFGGGNFTVDGWFRFNSISGQQGLFNNGDNDSYCGIQLLHRGDVDNKIDVFASSIGNSWDLVAAGDVNQVLAANTWYHIALERYGNTLTVFIDGIVKYQNTSFAGSLYNFTGPFRIGRGSQASQTFNGWIDEFLVQKGVGAYGGVAFTPPTVPYIVIPTNGPSPVTPWNFVPKGSKVQLKTTRILGYKNGVVITDPATTDLKFKYAQDGGALSGTWLTQSGLGATGDITIANDPETAQSITSITRSENTATATKTAHGYVTGDCIIHAGASQQEYNGPVDIIKLTDDTYTFYVRDAPATPATGTVTASRANIFKVQPQLNSDGSYLTQAMVNMEVFIELPDAAGGGASIIGGTIVRGRA